MAFLDNLPTIVYPLVNERASPGSSTVVPYTMLDITARVVSNMSDKNLLAITEPYTLSDGETPEAVSNALYKTPFFHWVILTINNIYDVYSEWCLSDTELESYAANVYGDKMNDPAYIVDSYGNVVSAYGISDLASGPVKYSGNVSTITNFQWEQLQNEKKRTIRVIKTAYLNQFVNTYNKEMSKAV